MLDQLPCFKVYKFLEKKNSCGQLTTQTLIHAIFFDVDLTIDLLILQRRYLKNITQVYHIIM